MREICEVKTDDTHPEEGEEDREAVTRQISLVINKTAGMLKKKDIKAEGIKDKQRKSHEFIRRKKLMILIRNERCSR